MAAGIQAGEGDSLLGDNLLVEGNLPGDSLPEAGTLLVEDIHLGEDSLLVGNRLGDNLPEDIHLADLKFETIFIYTWFTGFIFNHY